MDFRLPWSKLWCGYADSFYYLWFVLILGLIGLMYNIYQFKLIYFSKEVNPPSRWDNLRFFPIPPPLVRRFDLLKRFLQANAWALLIYAASLNHHLTCIPGSWYRVF
ncbi:uncharacterized protein LOC110185221 [Drosophila serrata]|uniref:uncharacterized protein LOC110185221 n=1 Tax=Drosophila serrata TaxID=7274 RepID=UPI000A1D35D4|nr:uncharacterized protein LOC110185221 [Drosophila serrata]